jgi:hypothetical protein
MSKYVQKKKKLTRTLKKVNQLVLKARSFQNGDGPLRHKKEMKTIRNLEVRFEQCAFFCE